MTRFSSPRQTLDAATVGAVSDRALFLESQKYARSQTAPTAGTSGPKQFCKRLLRLTLIAAALGLPASAQSIEMTTVVSRPVSRTNTLPGEVQAFLSVALHSRVTGYVERVLVDRGSVVKQGELLVELSAPEMKAQIVEAESKVQAAEADRLQAEAKLASMEATLSSLQANLATAQSAYDRLKTASQTPGAIAGNDLEAAQHSVESQRAGIDAQRASMQAQRASIEGLRNAKAAVEASVRTLKEMEAYLRVTAPFEGIVTQRDVHPGALVGPTSNSPLLTLQQVSRLRLVVAVPEADLGGIVKGAKVDFQVPAYPGRTYSATVARIPQSLDVNTRTMSVELDVINKDGALAPGMFPTVKWPVRSSQPAIFVPKTSVVTTAERTFVIRDKNGRAEWVDVRKSAVEGDLMQVIGQLQAGDRIVKRATDELRDGAAIH